MGFQARKLINLRARLLSTTTSSSSYTFKDKTPDSVREVVAITGGAAGLGKGTVRQFTLDGFDVVFCDVDETLGKEVAEEFKATFFKVDVTQPNEVEAFFDQIKCEFGRLDVLINMLVWYAAVVPLMSFPLNTFNL